MHLVENKLTGQHEVWSGKGELIPVKRSKIPRERMQVLANQLNKSLIQSLQCRSSVARLPRPSFAGVPLTKNTNWQLNAKATKINLDSDQQELDFPEEYADAGFWEAYLTEEYVDPWILAEFQQNKSPCQLAIESCENTCLGVGVIGGLLGAGMIFGTRSWAGTVVGAAILLGTAWGYDKCRSNCVPERLPGCK